MAAFDVYYLNDHARACSVVFEISPVERILSEHCQILEQFSEYVSGEFYRRELPCILRLLEEIQEGIELAIVDGFVFLKEGRKGLGAHLFESQNGKLPIIGVAKTYFEGCEDYRTVYRGNSVKPLYVSSIGIDLDYAAKLIKSMRGTYRIPDMLRKVDHLTRFEA